MDEPEAEETEVVSEDVRLHIEETGHLLLHPTPEECEVAGLAPIVSLSQEVEFIEGPDGGLELQDLGSTIHPGQLVRLSENAAALLNEGCRIYRKDQSFRKAARNRFREKYALSTANSTTAFGHEEAVLRELKGDGEAAPASPSNVGKLILFVVGVAGGLLNSWMAVGPDVRLLVHSEFLHKHAQLPTSNSDTANTVIHTTGSYIHEASIFYTILC
jgi:hypothetical protein